MFLGIDLKQFWTYGDLFRAAALAGGGIALMGTAWWAGVFIASAGVISFVDVWKNNQ